MCVENIEERIQEMERWNRLMILFTMTSQRKINRNKICEVDKIRHTR